ncbi:hypothetical protein [Paraburkholderia sp. SIMBA_030]|uniref:hypothetical protein n=1 Tax=Paraburkholderia sp. SIMBA_030 TaxID=3085773 RepID=UPI003979DD78
MKVFALAFAGCLAGQPAQEAFQRTIVARRSAAGVAMADVKPPVAPAIRIQMDTSFVADLIHNIKYDFGDHRSLEQSTAKRQWNNPPQSGSGDSIIGAM